MEFNGVTKRKQNNTLADIYFLQILVKLQSDIKVLANGFQMIQYIAQKSALGVGKLLGITIRP